MTSVTDICNRALQVIGTRTTVTDAELTNETSNEAIQFNLIYENLRDSLLRMAPWDCALRTANLTYITSQPGTPENTSAAQTLWSPGIPAPPWAYEYQYPVDCLRACYIVPANSTGFSGTPITTAVTGGSSAWYQGPPVKFKVQNDQFYVVTAAAVVAGGSGYAINDRIFLANETTSVALYNKIGPFNANAPQGAAAIIQPITVSGGGAVLTTRVVNQILGSDTAYGGSYFYPNLAAATQVGTDGSGTGATFTLTYESSLRDQRVILTNQEYATLGYVRQITDPNLMDPLFQDGWTNLIAAAMSMALKGDKTFANGLIQKTNASIELARSIDGNEGLTVNDVTPDWLRIRGVAWADGYVSGPYSGYDWGGTWPMYL